MAAEQAAFSVSGPAGWQSAAVLAAATAVNSATTFSLAEGDVTLTSAGSSHAGVKDALAFCAGSAPVGAGGAAEVSEFVDVAVNVLATDESFGAAAGTKVPMMRTLANMGVSGNSMQVAIKAAFAPSAALTAALDKVESALISSPFLGGAGAGAGDFAVAAALYESTALLGPAVFLGARPATTAWLSALAVGPLGAAFSALGTSLGGWMRIGGQVDKRPDPVSTGAKADASIALNAGYKKAANQRQKERAAAKEASAPAKPAAAASGGDGAGGNPFGVVATAEQRAANAEGVPALQDGIDRATSAMGEWGIPLTGPHPHAAAVDVAKYLEVAGGIGGVPCKNLFVKAKKAKGEGDSRMWLVILRHDTALNMKALATQLGYGKVVVRFGSGKDLTAQLGTAQGHVSPFSLMNDTALQVNVALDQAIVGAGAEETFLFHPFHNEASVGVTGGDLVKLVERTGHKWTAVSGE